MLTQILSAGLEGIEAYPIDVEVDIQNTHLPKWKTVGLAESAVRESQDRVAAAIKNSGYDFLFRKVTVNLAPADKRKEGTAFDLPIAIGMLVASKVLPVRCTGGILFVGELGLTGDVRAVKGVLSIAVLAKKLKVKHLVVPQVNAHEAHLVEGIEILPVTHFTEVVEFLRGELRLAPFVKRAEKSRLPPTERSDLSEVSGQAQAKRALEIAAAGGHNVLFRGPPGAGKTLMASCLPSILPPLNLEQSLETSQIYSVMGMLEPGFLFEQPPFRNPHHSISHSGLIGGGSYPKPGEVSLAHNGVLFLDEIFEFHRHVLEHLRQPMEGHQVTLARAAISLTYPARFLLVASCNPCPCGYKGHPKIECVCSPVQIQKYQSKMSGPLLDRIDLQVDVPPVSYEELRQPQKQAESSSEVLQRVLAAREKQKTRFSQLKIHINASMTTRQIREYCALDDMSEKVLKTAMEKFHLSARGVSRVLKVARTIADLQADSQVKMENVLEALQYRKIDGI